MTPANEIRVIETPTARYSLMENGIVYGQAKNGIAETLDTARENIRALRDVCAGKPAPVIVDIRMAKTISADARDHYAGEQAADIQLALALLIGNSISRLIGNFFLTLHQPLMPTRLFTNEAEAIKWLEGYLEM